MFATRPVTAPDPGLGLDAAQALALIAHFESLFPLLPDAADVYPRWKALVAAHQTMGKPAHDARLVAAMDAHGIPRILTFNGSDFARYRHVTVIDPTAVAAPTSPKSLASP